MAEDFDGGDIEHHEQVVLEVFIESSDHSLVTILQHVPEFWDFLLRVVFAPEDGEAADALDIINSCISTKSNWSFCWLASFIQKLNQFRIRFKGFSPSLILRKSLLHGF